MKKSYSFYEYPTKQMLANSSDPKNHILDKQ